jgi:hypothetical protein
MVRILITLEDSLKQQTIYGANLLSIDKFQLDINKYPYMNNGKK